LAPTCLFMYSAMDAVSATLREVRTPDVGGNAPTGDVTREVMWNFSGLRWVDVPDDDTTRTDWAV